MRWGKQHEVRGSGFRPHRYSKLASGSGRLGPEGYIGGGNRCYGQGGMTWIDLDG
jgi:hypothetical protein